MDIERWQRGTSNTLLEPRLAQVTITGTRFDAIVRGLPTARSRRTTLGLLLGGVLGLAGLGHGAAKGKGGKGKGKGKGKAKKQCKASATHCCSDADCRGRCDGTVCLSSGVCDCFPGRIRHNGVCGNADTVSCQSTLTIVSDPSECCSDQVIFDDGGQMRCAPGNFMCLTPFDCADGGPCRGFMCTAQYKALTGC